MHLCVSNVCVNLKQYAEYLMKETTDKNKKKLVKNGLEKKKCNERRPYQVKECERSSQWNEWKNAKQERKLHIEA